MKQMEKRTADPMSLSSIVSSNDHESTPPKQAYDSRRSSKASNSYPPFKQERPQSPPLLPAINNFTPQQSVDMPVQNGVLSHDVQPAAAQSRWRPQEKEIDLELARIDAIDDALDDYESRNEYIQRGLKRVLAVQASESVKRKVCSGRYVTTRPGY